MATLFFAASALGALAGLAHLGPRHDPDRYTLPALGIVATLITTAALAAALHH